MLKLPSEKIVRKNTPIYPGSDFSWGEVTANLTRPLEDLILENQLVLTSLEIEESIVLTAKYLDEVRSLLGGRPLIINSWYRPFKINKKVGGSSNSRHMFGDGVDFYSNYLPSYQVYRLLDNWHGDRGGLGAYYRFVHLDLRGEKTRWQV